MKKTLAAVALLALVAFASAQVYFVPTPLQDVQTTAPNRPADYTVDSGWVTPNKWDVEDPTDAAAQSENTLTYPIRVRIPQPGTVGIVYRQKLEYRYVGDVFVSSLAPAPVGFSAGSWDAFFLGHSPNGIGGPGAVIPHVPFVESPFNATIAGGGSWSQIIPNDGQVHPIDVLVTYAEHANGGYLPAGLYTFQQSPTSFARWGEVDGIGRDGAAYHELWFTPVEDDAWQWQWMAQVPRGSYSHSISYGVQLIQRVTLDVWELQPGEVHP